MLNGRLELHGVDAETLCERVLANWLRKIGTTLNHEDHEDALAFLVSKAWELAEFTFQPARGTRFDSYAYGILSYRCTDWLRLDEGRLRWRFSTHEYVREKPVVLSLDGPAHRSDNGDSVRLGELVSVPDSGDETDRDTLLRRLERERDRERTRDLNVLRERLYQRAAA